MSNVLDVAQYILTIAEKDGADIEPMKLLKLTYIAYGWFTLSDDGRLFDQKIEAWRYGPVIPDLYHSIKKFKDKPIIAKIGDANNLTENKKNWISKIYRLYKRYNGLQLSSMTHKENTPWSRVYHDGFSFSNIEIPDNIIKQYYRKLYEKARARAKARANQY